MDPITAIGLIAAVLAVLTFFGFPTLCALWKRLRPALSSATGGVLVVDPFVEALPAYLAWLEPMKTLPINAIVDSGGGAKVLVTEVYTPQHIAVLPDLSARAAALTAKEARETEAKAAGGSIQEAQDDEAQEATDAARGDPAETERNPAEPGLHGRDEVSTRAPPTLASDDFLDRQRQAIILGDPGMGKSTLAAHRLVEALAILDDDPDAPFPIVIDIKQYVFHCGDVTVDWLDSPEYVARRGATAGWRVATAELEERLAQKPSLVIFDGLDEAIDLVKRREMVDRIIGFAKTHERAKILLTSRIAGFHENSEDPLRAAGFLVGQLRPLSRDGVKSLASRVAEHLPSLSTPAIERVMASYDQVESVRDLCGNPLLLTMMTPFAASDTLPESRAKLYDKALDKLVYGWEERTAGPGDLGGKDRAEIHDILSSDDRKEMLRRAARFVSEDEARLTENLISETDLRAAFQDYLLEVKGTSRENITRRLDEAIELFRGRNRILADQGSGEGGRSFGFLHRSFLEYLTATDLENRYIKRPNQFHEVEALFRDKALVEVWREPLLLLIGLLHGEYANDAIEAALPEVVEGPDDVNRLIFALACFNELDEGTLRAVQSAARRAVAGLSTLWRIAPDDDEQGRRIWG